MEPRRSYQTLEFWLTIAAMVVSIAMVVVGGVVDNPEASKVLQVLGAVSFLLESMGYKVIRTIQKGNDVKAAAITAVGAPKDPS